MYDMYPYSWGEGATVSRSADPPPPPLVSAVQVSLDRRDNGGIPGKVQPWLR
jgi:hypothetical protein